MLTDGVGGQLLFTTVRIFNDSPAGVSVGTGFFFIAKFDGDTEVPLIITNKHVLLGATRLRLELMHYSADGSGPELGSKIDLAIDVDAANPPWTGHPDAAVDVAALPIGPHLEAMKAVHGLDSYRVNMTADNFPTSAEAEGFDAIEDLVFVGYPNGHADETHLTPITRRAISATPLSLPFGGTPTFLLDGSVFGGSSGSPVYLYDRYGYASGGTYFPGSSRVRLVGIVAQTLLREDSLPLEVHAAPHTRVAKELNLGVAHSWKSIDETVDAVCAAHGVMRTG